MKWKHPMEKVIKEYLTFLSGHLDPIIRWKAARNLINMPHSSLYIEKWKNELVTSPIIQRLLSDRKADGRIPCHPYDKWFGAHWVLSILADLGYPEGDESLRPLMEQCYEWLLSKEHQKYIRMINSRVRRCASQEGNCIYYSLALGLSDDRTEELVARLLKWQWEDGGWNCDKHPEASVSSFNETLIPLRGLSWYVKLTADPIVMHAVDRASEVFLKRQLIKRLRNGQIIDQNFVKLHYPNYWHYDFLFALKVMSEAGFIDDPRCAESLDLLENKCLPDGGFPAEEKYYRVDDKKLAGHSRVNWGGTSKMHSNPFVSLDALIVLKHSGRIVL
jgi:hypothetical protein